MSIATTRPCCCIALVTRVNWSKRSVASRCGTRNNRLFIRKFTPHPPPEMVRAWPLTMPQKPDGVPSLAQLALVVTIAAGGGAPDRAQQPGPPPDSVRWCWVAGSAPGRAAAAAQQRSGPFLWNLRPQILNQCIKRLWASVEQRLRR
jgi:hypothetical protein